METGREVVRGGGCDTLYPALVDRILHLCCIQIYIKRTNNKLVVLVVRVRISHMKLEKLSSSQKLRFRRRNHHIDTSPPV